MAFTRKPHSVSISQGIILDKLYSYYAAQPYADPDIIEAINPAGVDNNGHCAGFTVLALYGSWLAFLPHDATRRQFPKDDYAWFEQLLIQIASVKETAALNVNGEIDRFLGMVRYYQVPYLTRRLQSEVEALLMDTRDRRFVVEYKLTGIFSVAALIKPLLIRDKAGCMQAAILNVIAPQHKMVIITSETHVTGLIRHHHCYYYYDPNATYGREAYFDLQQLAKNIMESHLNKNKVGTLSFKVIDVETAAKGKYPAQESLLSALYAVFPVSFDNYLIYQADALNLSALSASVELVRFYADMLRHRPESLNQPAGGKLTCLHFAAVAGCIESMELVLRLGVSVNVRDKHQTTPLLMAVFLNRLSIVKYLLEAGADPNSHANSQSSALLIALRKRHFEVIELLLSSKQLIVSVNEYEMICLIHKREPANSIIQRAVRRIVSREVQADEKVIELIQKDEILSDENKWNQGDLVVTELKLNMTVSEQRTLTLMMQVVMAAAPLIAVQMMPVFLRPAAEGQRTNSKAQRGHREHSLFKQQPQHIKRDAHYTLPGHHGKRSVR